MGNHKYYIYMCNAIDDVVKAERRITTDSPAASNKVFGISRALASAKARVVVLSMGRGRQDGSGRRYSARLKRSAGIPVIYAAFLNIPFLTHIVSSFSLMFCLWRIIRKRRAVLIAYNRFPYYLPTLLLARAAGIPCYLDLEDGFMREKPGIFNKILVHIFQILCPHGALLACSALGGQVNQSRKMVCYGIASPSSVIHDWEQEKIKILFGGTLCRDTGCRLFMDAVYILMEHYPRCAEKIRFTITGKGEMAEEIARFAAGPEGDIVEFLDVVSTNHYRRVVNTSHAGLCLKLVSSGFHTTTFPSKVIELAAAGLLLISTRVSDVPLIFPENSAMFLPDETPRALAEAIVKVERNRANMQNRASRGMDAVDHCCSARRVGSELKAFLNGG